MPSMMIGRSYFVRRHKPFCKYTESRNRHDRRFRRSRTINMGNDVARLRGHWLHGLSSEVKASIDGYLIRDHQV